MIVSTSGKTPDGSATTVANHPDIVAAKCPACTSSSVVPILYGAPSEVHVLLFTRRRAWPGGAMGRLLNRQAPQWHCNDCGHQWRGGLFAGGAGTCLGEAVVIRIGSTAVGVRAEKQLAHRGVWPGSRDRREPVRLDCQRTSYCSEWRPRLRCARNQSTGWNAAARLLRRYKLLREDPLRPGVQRVFGARAYNADPASDVEGPP